MTEQDARDTRAPDLNTQELETTMIDWEKEVSSANFDCDWASCISHPCHDECSQSNHTYGCGSSSFCDDPSVCMEEDCIQATCDSSCHSAFEHCSSICAKDIGPITGQQMILDNHVDDPQDSVPCPWLLPDQQCDAMVARHALQRHIDEQHIDPQLTLRCSLDSCSEVVQKTSLPSHQAQHHQLDSYICNSDDCLRTYPTSNGLLDHIQSNHGQLDCRIGGCEVSTTDPMQLKHHIVEDHLDLSQFSWSDDAVFDHQYPANDTCLAPPNSMADAVNYPAYLPNGGHPPTQYYGSNLPYPSAYDIESAGYNQPLPSLPNYYHHRTFADQVQTAWHASQPSYPVGVTPENDRQAADQTKCTECSPTAATPPSSKSELQTTGHICQWVMDSGNNVLCSQTFDTAKELQEHLRHDHCSTCSATRQTQKASAVCRWNGCSRNREPLTDVHKLIRHALTHSNYRDYVCSFCKKACTTKGQLVIHERVHTGEKPIKCEFCSKTTSNESQMGEHRHDVRISLHC